MILPGDDGVSAKESRVLTMQVREIASIDASSDRTRLYFQVEPRQYSTDVLTLTGFVPVKPGTKVRVTVEFVDDEIEGGA